MQKTPIAYLLDRRQLRLDCGCSCERRTRYGNSRRCYVPFQHIAHCSTKSVHCR